MGVSAINHVTIPQTSEIYCERNARVKLANDSFHKDTSEGL